MSQIDLKEATIKLWDGTQPTVTLDMTNVKADLTFTAVSRHLCSRQISVTVVNPGTTHALEVAVSGLDITITLAYSGAVTSTAEEVVAAVVASAAASALVTVTHEDDGSGVCNAKSKAYLTGANSLTVKIGEGNLTYTEHRKVEFTKDRGIIDTVRLAEDEPMDVSFDFTWEFLMASTGADETVEDVLKKRGEGATWVSSATDQCQPHCIDIEIVNAPNCAAIENEVIVFEEFYYESLDHDLKDGSVSCKGRCNRKEVTVNRVAAA